MIGLASRMRSPSSRTMTRRTPWVAGCWGPKETSISSLSVIDPMRCRSVLTGHLRSSTDGPPPGG